MIPLKINGYNLCSIFEPALDTSGWSDSKVIEYSLKKMMFPTLVDNTSETYSRDAERTADYELANLVLVNRKAKPEFTWSLIRADYVENLFDFLDYNYNFKNDEGIVIPQAAPDINVTYQDFTGKRTIVAYLGQTISGTLVEYDGVLYWENFRIAFPEK